MSVRYGTIAPRNSFLGAYMEYMHGHETPVIYDFWTGLWLLSTVVARRLYVARPRTPVPLNLYVMLCAESGTTRKSTAVTEAVSIYNKFHNKEALPHTDVNAPAAVSEIEKSMAFTTREFGCASVIVNGSEGAIVLPRRNSELPMHLTDWYDCPADRKNGTIRDIYATLLVATTPAWLVRAMSPVIIEGGFTSRCFFVVSENSKRRIAWPTQPQVDADGLAAILQSVSKLIALIRNIEISNSALTRYSEWYNTRETSNDSFRRSFEAREGDHVLKVAGLLAINDTSFIITQSHIDNALQCVYDVKERGASLFVSALGSDSATRLVDAIRTELLAAGLNGIDHGKLLRRFSRDTQRMRLALLIMHELDLVQRFYVPGKGHKNKTLWRCTSKLAQKGVVDAVLRKLEPEADMPSDETANME